ncbi:GDP-fucose protein O-fucosyltransferase 1 [Holothuria leucospilota]|uniref:GDP-fucose protein O-fucosyltransferase 1 n=1 Tax=Holothuria leucospilota TaxID=206669 RepID=A0A9Q1H538_HOLLE|nr:GDP-fucose protein O-fucosyltransferase 1 [Holothuria leucospilota]
MSSSRPKVWKGFTLQNTFRLVCFCIVAKASNTDHCTVNTSAQCSEGSIDEYSGTILDHNATPVWDDSGYVMFCPCMGNFGNQAEYYIGSLAFAKSINRTLVLTPFRAKGSNIPFSEWFQIEPVRQFHRVIPIETFLEHFGETEWAPGKRKGYCGRSTDTLYDCKMKSGNPLGPFWDDLNISFDESVPYDTFDQADISNEKRTISLRNNWNKQFPSAEHPVLALRCAPASFPMAPGNRKIHQYLKWNPSLFSRAEDEIARMFHGEKYVGIHLRTGPDWVTSCSMTIGARTVMASPQCLTAGQPVFIEMCYPTVEHIVDLTTKAVIKYAVQHLFIATDRLSYSKELTEALTPLGVKVHHLDPQLPQMDLMILGQSDFFIGNCASSFTSFVKRERDVSGKPSTFWGFPV